MDESKAINGKEYRRAGGCIGTVVHHRHGCDVSVWMPYRRWAGVRNQDALHELTRVVRELFPNIPGTWQSAFTEVDQNAGAGHLLWGTAGTATVYPDDELDKAVYRAFGPPKRKDVQDAERRSGVS